MRTLALALLLPVLAGCVTQSQPPEPAAQLLGSGVLGDVQAEGAQVVPGAQGAELVWKGTAATTAGQPLPVALPDVAGAGEALLARFTMPTGATGLDADLRVPAGVDLDFYVNNPVGYVCRSRGGTAQDPQHEHCRAYIPGPRAGPEAWTVQVVDVQNPGPPAAFELHLHLSAQPFRLLGDPLPPAQQDARLAFANVRVDDERRTAEPSLKVDDQGTVWLADRTGTLQTLWRSTDGARFARVDILNHSDAAGQAWQQVGSGGGDSDVAVTPDGKEVYFADLWSGYGNGCNSLASSSDGGQTWSVDPAACELPLTDRQWVVAKPGGHVWLTYNAEDPASQALLGSGLVGQMVVMHSVDAGRTWLTKTVVPEDACARGNLALAPDGTLFAAGCDARGPAVAVSTDDGATFAWHQVADRGSGFCDAASTGCLFTVVATDSAGNAYVAWMDRSLGTWHVFLSHSSDRGATWTAPVRVDHDEGTAVMPWVAARGPGQVALAWYASRLPDDAYEYEGGPATDARSEGEWYVHAAESLDALDAQPRFAERTVRAEPVQYGPICLDGAGCKSQRNLLDFLMVDVGKDGAVHVAYADGRLGGMAYDSYVMYARSAGLP
jgi:hypothetical protein